MENVQHNIGCSARLYASGPLSFDSWYRKQGHLKVMKQLFKFKFISLSGADLGTWKGGGANGKNEDTLLTVSLKRTLWTCIEIIRINSH